MTRVNTGGNLTEFHRDGTGVTAPVISDGEHVITPGTSTRPAGPVGQTTFLHGGLKDVSAQSNAQGQLSGTKVYDAYGAALSGTGSWTGRFGYGGLYGYQEDGNNLQLLGNRYYDPTTGTFITRDPIKDGRNWYGYCDNNPINAIDADGLYKIVLYGWPVGHSGAWHWQIVIFEDDGSWVEYSAGPEKGMEGELLGDGGIVRAGKRRGPGTYVPRKGATSKTLVNRPGESGKKFINIASRYVAWFNAQKLGYNILGPNSNTFCCCLLMALGFNFMSLTWVYGTKDDPRDSPGFFPLEDAIAPKEVRYPKLTRSATG